MQPYQQRVIDEKAELDIKIAKLDYFRVSGEMSKIPVDQQDLLDLQHNAMLTYSIILELRIKSFNAP
ncbi:MAG: hypothetical protein IPK63_18695 [Candidatus Competibacteraceae bacterium]|jgi:hypothetical protein|nr:hypothetical protein [Candidatus Competibacteraceae bacterium]